MIYKPNPDLVVGAGNKQRWNQPAHRRHGFHNAHLMFRRVLSLRAPNVRVLNHAPEADLTRLSATQSLLARPECSALICVRGDDILLSHHAKDFPEHQPHSIQSISKLFLHRLSGKFIENGLLDLEESIEQYVPEIGSGYRGASVQAVLDMNVSNDFTEDYTDPNSACFDEEIALGWRLPADGAEETTLTQLVQSIQSDDINNHTPFAQYRSSNSDLLTVICDRLASGALLRMTEEFITAAGIEHSFHISLSAEGLPTFSGGGCFTATDLARFGLLLAQPNEFTRASIARPAKTLPPPRDHVRYSNHLMTNGRWFGHAGYGGQFLMVDPTSSTVCVFLSVLENEDGYCIDYMADTITYMEQIITAVS